MVLAVVRALEMPAASTVAMLAHGHCGQGALVPAMGAQWPGSTARLQQGASSCHHPRPSHCFLAASSSYYYYYYLTYYYN